MTIRYPGLTQRWGGGGGGRWGNATYGHIEVRRNRITKEITGKLVKGLVITFWGQGRDFPLLSCKCHAAGQQDLNRDLKIPRRLRERHKSNRFN